MKQHKHQWPKDVIQFCVKCDSHDLGDNDETFAQQKIRLGYDPTKERPA